jgi:hypothetical protein
MKQENPDQTLYQALDHLLDKLQLCQRALGPAYAGEDALRITVIRVTPGFMLCHWSTID